MEKYHIYEEIGKGNFSQVFKGREKKKIEYVAIKRIEKSEMPKIVAEVQVMHKLSHPHVLRFYDWYETKHNLWLILEYCTGGDLETILKQDGHLPETSIRIFGLDMVAGLKYLHSLGYIHCDLRPRNFLIDEYGILKISDFKKTTKIPTQSLGQKPISERGLTPYMAPELFTAEAANSFQSDFWALGCVLYELRRGFAPFGDFDERMDTVMDNVRSIDPISTPVIPASLITPGKSSKQQSSSPVLSSISNPFADLLRGLLEKSLLYRCNWEQLCLHPFWRPANPPPPQQLPSQPIVDTLLREMERMRSELLQKQIYSEMGVYSNSASDIYVKNDFIAQAKSSSSSPTKATTTTPSVPGSRSSRRQWDEEDVLVPPSSQAKSTITGATSAPRSGVSSAVAESKVSSESRAHATSDTKRRLFEDEVSPRNKTPQPLDNNQLPLPNPEFFSAVGENETVSNMAGHKAATRHAKSSVLDTPFNAGAPAAAGRGSAAPPPPIDSARVGPITARAADSSTTSGDLLWDLVPETILSHGSDSQVKPIVGNRAIEDSEDPEFNDKNGATSFSTYKLDRITQMNQEEIEAHLTQLYKLLYKSATSAQSSVANATVVGALTERVSILSYLSSIAACVEVANVVLNTHFLSLLLKLLKTTTNYQATQPLRNQSPSQNAANAATSLAQQSRYLCAHNLAMMLRFATYIQAPTIRSREDHIVGTLIQVLKDTQGTATSARTMSTDARMRRKAAAALGEMIFYISAQDEETPVTNNNENADKWTLANSTVEFIIKSLKDELDEIIKHYFAKTIENVQAQGGFSYRKRFISYDLCLVLLELAQNNHRNESLQSTCAMALYHILYFALHFHQDPLSATYAGTRENVSSAGKSGSAGGSTNNGRRANSQPSTATLDPFASPSIVNSARFLVKILEKANLGSMVEVFQDGTPKLQQAFLNIILLIFVAPLGSYAGTNITTASTEMNVLSAMKSETEAMLQELQQQAVFASLGMMVIVSDPPTSRVDPAQLSSLLALLSPLRSYFLRAHMTLMPALFRLMDQGGVTPLRAKAMLLVQCLCSHMPSLLFQLPDRKFSAALVRILEPYLSALELQYQQQQQQLCTEQSQATKANQNLHANTAKKLSSPTYLMKAAMSMLVFFRKTFLHHVVTLTLYVEEMGQANLLPGTNAVDDDEAPYQSSKRTSLSPTSPGKNSKTSNKTPSGAVTADGRLSFSITQFLNVTKLVRTLATLFASPSLVRILLPNSVEFVLWLSRTMQVLPAARARLAALPRNTTETSLLEALDAAEQTTLLCLEFVAQVDIPSYYLPSIAFSQSNDSQQHANTNLLLLQQKLSQWSVLITMTLQRLVPAASRMLSHPEVDIRIMIAGTFRRLLPNYLRAFFLAQHPDVHLFDQQQQRAPHPNHKRPATKSLLATVQTMLSTMLSTYLLSAPSQLTDVAPIPQYTLRTYNDIFMIHPLLIREVLTTTWKQGNVLPVLIQMLQIQSTNTSNNNTASKAANDVDSVTQSSSNNDATNGQNGLDPLLLTILRQLWDVGQGQELQLLQQDLAGALTVAMIATIYAQVSYPFCRSTDSSRPEKYEDDNEENNHNDGTNNHNTEIAFETILPMLDMLYTMLHFVLKLTSQPPQSPQSNASPSRPSTADMQQQCRRLVTSLRATSPALLVLIAYADYHLLNAQQNSGFPSTNNSDNITNVGYPTRPNSVIPVSNPVNAALSTGSALHHILDLTTKCLGMLFDLFPDIVTSQLLSRQSVLLDQPSSGFASSMMPAGFVDRDALSPRLILTSVLYNTQVDLRVIAKILKIFYGVSKVAVNLGHVTKVKDWLTQDPVYPALTYASRWSRLTPYLPPGRTHDNHHQHNAHSNQPSAQEMVNNIQRFAAQIMDLALSLSTNNNYNNNT